MLIMYLMLYYNIEIYKIDFCVQYLSNSLAAIRVDTIQVVLYIS